MFRVFNCLTQEHDWWLLELAGLVCLLASLVAVSLYHRSHTARARVRSRHAWILPAGVAMGCGIWATYFIAMTACEPRGAWTAVFLVIAAIVAVAGLSVAAAALARWARTRRLLRDSKEQLRQQNVASTRPSTT